MFNEPDPYPIPCLLPPSKFKHEKFNHPDLEEINKIHEVPFIIAGRNYTSSSLGMMRISQFDLNKDEETLIWGWFNDRVGHNETFTNPEDALKDLKKHVATIKEPLKKILITTV